MMGLTPELLTRLSRIAKKQNRSLAQVLHDAVQEYWIRFATRERLKPEEW
jgi:predicted transcriptional regulator